MISFSLTHKNAYSYPYLLYFLVILESLRNKLKIIGTDRLVTYNLPGGPGLPNDPFFGNFFKTLFIANSGQRLTNLRHHKVFKCKVELIFVSYVGQLKNYFLQKFLFKLSGER